MTMFRRMAGIALAGALSVASASPTMAQTAIRAVLGGDLQVRDPIASTSYPSRTFGYLVYDTLVARDADGNIRPQMLESWKIDDGGLTYTFTLRDGLTWHDGTPVRPQDCIASIRRWGQRDGLGIRLLAATESMTVTGEKSFVVKLKEPFGLVLEALAKESSNVPFMMPEALASTPATQALTVVNGSGPFRFKADEFVPGSHAVFIKNPTYKPRSEPASRYAGAKIVNVDRVELRWLPDPATRVSALVRGEIDYLQYVPFDLLPILQSSRDVVLFNPGAPASNMGLIRLNHAAAPLDNPQIRLALQAAIDPAEALFAQGAPAEYVMPGCTSYFTCGGPYEAKSDSGTALNAGAAKAREMLRAAGYNNEPLRFMGFAPATDPVPPVLVDQLKRAGFNAEIQYFELNALFEKRTSKAPIREGGWSGFMTFLAGTDVESPVTHLYIANSCNPDYPGWSCDQETASLLTAFTRELDPAKRAAIADKISTRSHLTVPAVIWGQYIIPTAWRTSLTNVIGSVPSPVFWGMTKAR
jgi:peptide/nickel transport system substrate-binding protein